MKFLELELPMVMYYTFNVNPHITVFDAIPDKVIFLVASIAVPSQLSSVNRIKPGVRSKNYIIIGSYIRINL